ncbi:MAG: hypothetical protein QOJ07_3734 [Thermoleophilaceae bacterium]|nr:hypothetical protein [Thermoleophilaceae bacterium]
MTALLALTTCLAAARCLSLRRRLTLVARAEHELRGPLTTLVLALPAGARVDTELARVRLGLADLAAARCGRRTAPRPEPVALASIATAAAAPHEGRVQVDWSAGPALIHADPGRLSQALGNLVANAVEHGTGRVTTRGRRAGTRVRVDVLDDGPGLPRRRRKRPAGRGRGRGHGQGLAIAAQAAADSGGELHLAAHSFPALDLPG